MSERERPLEQDAEPAAATDPAAEAAPVAAPEADVDAPPVEPETAPAEPVAAPTSEPIEPAANPVSTMPTDGSATEPGPAVATDGTAAAGDAAATPPTGDDGSPARAPGEPGTVGGPSVPGPTSSTGSSFGSPSEPRTGPDGRPLPEQVIRPPRRVRHGVKLAGKEAPKIESPLSVRFAGQVAALVTDAEESHEAMKYARAGQTLSLEFGGGGVEARIQGHRGKPYRVVFDVPEWERPRRDTVVTALADEAASLAALLDGRLPEGLDEMLAGLDLSIIPPVPAPTCDCSRGAGCRHVGAVGMLVAERLEREPLLALAMRGLPSERLLERLRQQRALAARGLVSAHPDPDVPEARVEATPLGEELDRFWRPGARRTELAMGLEGGAADHGLLRRLGASPLGGQFPLVGLLASIYDAVSTNANDSEAATMAWSVAARDGEDIEVDDIELDVATDRPDAERVAEVASEGESTEAPAAGAPPTKPKAKARARARRRD